MPPPNQSNEWGPQRAASMTLETIYTVSDTVPSILCAVQARHGGLNQPASSLLNHVTGHSRLRIELSLS